MVILSSSANGISRVVADATTMLAAMAATARTPSSSQLFPPAGSSCPIEDETANPASSGTP